MKNESQKPIREEESKNPETMEVGCRNCGCMRKATRVVGHPFEGPQEKVFTCNTCNLMITVRSSGTMQAGMFKVTVSGDWHED